MGTTTMKEIWDIVIWSLEALFAGEWPSQDHRTQPWTSPADIALAGKNLAGDFRGVVWILKGDLYYFSKVLGLRNYNSNQPCDLCPCDKSREK